MNLHIAAGKIASRIGSKQAIGEYCAAWHLILVNIAQLAPIAHINIAQRRIYLISAQL
jgi:hypothetical protein